MDIRTAQPEDFSQLANLLYQLNPKDPKLAESDYNTFLEILNTKHLKLIVAEQNATLIGSCYLNIILNLSRGARPYAVIENVITDISHRNKGVGKALIATAIELAQSANCYKVMLMTGRNEAAVHNFYKQCGFVAGEKHAFICRLP